jgi:hypothetical protein
VAEEFRKIVEMEELDCPIYLDVLAWYRKVFELIDGFSPSVHLNYYLQIKKASIILILREEQGGLCDANFFKYNK